MSRLNNLITKIDHKVNDEAQRAIDRFQTVVKEALKELLCMQSLGGFKLDAKTCIANLLEEGRREWPAVIWSKRRDKIECEILQTMDMVAKTLVAPEPKSDKRDVMAGALPRDI